ncbi:MAG: VCBS repeat-containing protein [Planctomycetaceae bacterium]|nr:VCBS repeat-containing protein [Planctomycetaceae bacterium]
MSSPSNHGKQAPRRRIMVLVGLLLLSGIAVIWWKSSPSRQTHHWLAKAKTAWESGDSQQTIDYASLVLNREPDRQEAHLLIARAAAELDSYQLALDHCQQIDDTVREPAIEARLLSGDIFRKISHDLENAEREYKRALRIDSKRLDARARLIDLLALQTRTDELVPHVIRFIERGEVKPEYVMLLASDQRLAPRTEVLQSYAQELSTASGIRLAMARRAALERDIESAKTLLQQILDENPDWGLAQGRLGQLLVSQADQQQWQTWNAKLPTQTEHPLIWEARGLGFLQRSQTETAIRCFLEALSRDPNLATANYQLGQSLVQIGDIEAAQPFLQRARDLQEYDRLLDLRTSESSRFRSRIPYAQASELAESLGLLWEAYAWALLSKESGEHDSALTERVRRIRSMFPDLPTRRTAAGIFPIDADLREAYPMPRSNDVQTVSPRRSQSSDETVAVRFSDIALAAGIDFSYFNDSSPQVRGLGRMYEFTGGGVAVLDYDRDGWPDLYLTQGQRWSTAERDPNLKDQLYRNGSQQTFDNVTGAAKINENRFSQGATVGDFNNDGFPDLYVGNIGVNQLFINQGDGTFREAEKDSSSQEKSWTTSCLMADLNADGLPDLYDVNYLSGPRIFEIACRDERGFEQPCAPQDFSGTPDQCFLNLGNGGFRNISTESGVALAEGKGMGIVCWQRPDAATPDLLVSNDGVPNFYLVNESPSAGEMPKFQDLALMSGLAVNHHGESEACMGIASGDWDGDSRLDFFITNFTDESNTLYCQQSEQLFTDETANAGLQRSSFKLLGFGTQAIDGNLDGQLDLAITNGHIDDYSEQGLDYEMQPQFYRNTGNLTFVEQVPEETGPYFSRKLLGRGMSKLDFNRDGLEDLAISHLDAPLALLKNETNHTNNFLTITLTGIECSRDAIGTIVTLNTSAGTLTRQMTAGDGYQASNQRHLVFGLGKATDIAMLKIHWPSGTIQEFPYPPINCRLHFVEGEGFFRLPD